MLAPSSTSEESVEPKIFSCLSLLTEVSARTNRSLAALRRENSLKPDEVTAGMRCNRQVQQNVCVDEIQAVKAAKNAQQENTNVVFETGVI